MVPVDSSAARIPFPGAATALYQQKRELGKPNDSDQRLVEPVLLTAVAMSSSL